MCFPPYSQNISTILYKGILYSWKNFWIDHFCPPRILYINPPKSTRLRAIKTGQFQNWCRHWTGVKVGLIFYLEGPPRKNERQPPAVRARGKRRFPAETTADCRRPCNQLSATMLWLRFVRVRRRWSYPFVCSAKGSETTSGRFV